MSIPADRGFDTAGDAGANALELAAVAGDDLHAPRWQFQFPIQAGIVDRHDFLGGRQHRRVSQGRVGEILEAHVSPDRGNGNQKGEAELGIDQCRRCAANRQGGGHQPVVAPFAFSLT